MARHERLIAKGGYGDMRTPANLKRLAAFTRAADARRADHEDTVHLVLEICRRCTSTLIEPHGTAPRRGPSSYCETRRG